MAMNYQNFASLGVNLNRQKYGPLDISNVFTSAADLQYYLTKGTFTEGVSEYWYKNANEKIVPYPYEGQVLATVIDGLVNVYVLTADTFEEDDITVKTFKTSEIGAKVEVDGKTIKLNAAGKLELVGLPADITGKTLVPSLVNGELTWAEPDTSTAEGQAQEIEGLKTRATALEATVNGTGEGESHVPGLVDKVAALEAVDNATQAELDAYKEEVASAIAAGVQEAKNYADEQDADTIYNDSELRGRIEVIEGDYLKEADKYNDAELRGLISNVNTAVETEKSRAEAAEKALGERIDAIDFINPEELASAVAEGVTEAKGYTDEQIQAVNEAISKLNHFTTKIVSSIDEVTETGVLYLIKDESVAGVDKYNEYILVDDAAVLIGDTTTDLSDYYTKSDIDGKVQTLEGAISDEATARGQLADKVAALEEVDNATQEELDAYKTEVASAIAIAKSEAIADADNKLADKVNTSDFDEFKEDNTTAIEAAKQAAIDAAASAEESKGYATGAQLTEAIEGIENDLLAYAKTSDVNAELAKKIETGSIAHTTDEVAEGVTVNGTQMNIVVDAFTKAETRQYVADTISQMTGGESAADVLLALNNYKSDNDERVGAIETKNGEQDTAIAKAQGDATKGIEDAAKVASDLDAAELLIAANTREIETVKGTITTVNETLSGKVTALENKDTEIAGLISGLDTTVKGHTTTITEHGNKITALENEDLRLAGLIQGNTDKFAGYYTKGEVDTKVQEAIDAIPDVDLEPYAKTADVNDALALKANAADVYTKDEANAEFMTQDEVDNRINALIAASDPDGDGNVITNIENLIEYVENNAGEIAALVTANNANTAKLAGIDTTVTDYVDAAIAGLVMPKASTEITIAEDGTLGLGEVSTDKLVMGTDTLVIDGGSAV